MTSGHRFKYGWILAAGVVLAGAVWWLWDDAVSFVNYAVSAETHTGLFLAMFALLPLVGFPISAFLILIGIKFGAWVGLLVLFAGMPIHLVVSFLVANSAMRVLLRQGLEKLNYRLPQIPKDRVLWFSLVFMAVPGLPYTVKNYTLPLAGAPFRHYFLSGYLVQGAMGIPLVVAGGAVIGEHLILLAVVLALLIALYVFVQRLRRRNRDLLKVDTAPVLPPTRDNGANEEPAGRE